MIGGDQPEQLQGQRVSADYFRVLGISPIMGRDFQASEDRYRGPNVVILSDNLWRRRFGGDRAIIGRQIRLAEPRGSAGDDLYTVIGVMPAGFENVLDPEAELWAPLQYNVQGIADPGSREWGHHLRTVGRLRPGVTAQQATQDLTGIGRALIQAQRPETYDANPQSTEFTATSLQSEITRSVKPALLAVIGAVILVLLIACVNVTNLLLARGAQRRGEFAMRAALGAQPARMLRQLLTESVLLGTIAGALGLFVAEFGVRALLALSPPGLPRMGAIRIDTPVFIFAATATMLVSLIVGLMPAFRAARSDPHQSLQQSGRTAAGGQQTARRSLVVTEVALALVLLVSAGLLLHSLQRLFAVDVGFDGSNVLTMQLQGDGASFNDDGFTNLFFQKVLDSVRRLPGVTSAGFTQQLPLSGDLDQYGAHFAATPTQPADTYPIFRYAVTPGYIETMRIPSLRGRLLTEHDDQKAPFVALISESLAKARFHDADPIGQRLEIGTTGPYTIVGVVGDVKQASLALSESDAVYIPNTQWKWAENVMSLVVRTNGNAATLAPAIRNLVWDIDKDVPTSRVATMEHLLAASQAQRRFALIIFEVFALVGLVLAATGLYGVLSGSVTERTREIGVRSALGATRGNILTLILKQGVTLTSIGVAIGLLAAAAASRALVSLLFGISRLDPLTYGGVIVLLVVVSILACSVPAWRAARVDPAITLRAE
jgi:putative ABC transport system permease protein